ncbi:hypothetical protein C8R44DRAFT_885278 [Mycena epipterygia]|nr:hypothetical protein C8R44DRAFT_885278 [Mycena epipterygia]
MSDVPELTAVISEMGHGIWQLKHAVARTHTGGRASSHTLLASAPRTPAPWLLAQNVDDPGSFTVKRYLHTYLTFFLPIAPRPVVVRSQLTPCLQPRPFLRIPSRFAMASLARAALRTVLHGDPAMCASTSRRCADTVSALVIQAALLPACVCRLRCLARASRAVRLGCPPPSSTQCNDVALLVLHELVMRIGFAVLHAGGIRSAWLLSTTDAQILQ